MLKVFFPNLDKSNEITVEILYSDTICLYLRPFILPKVFISRPWSIDFAFLFSMGRLNASNNLSLAKGIAKIFNCKSQIQF